MKEIDVVLVGYRSEAHLPRLISDLKDLTANEYELHYFDNTGNPRTLSALWNDLAGEGKARYLAVLNPDIALPPQWDVRLMECLHLDSTAGLVTADPTPFTLVTPSREEMEKFGRERRGRRDVGTDLIQFFIAFMERWAWEQLRGVDERMRFYMQDIDLIVRMSERLGRRTIRAFSCPVWHYGSASTHEARNRKEIDSQKECDFASWIFNEIRHGRMKEWDRLTDEERQEIRKEERFSRIPKPE